VLKLFVNKKVSMRNFMSNYIINNNRLLLEISKQVREINRNTINPEIPELRQNDLNPIITLVAKARAAYVKEVFDLSNMNEEDNSMPSSDQIRHLRNLRESYDELLNAAHAVETAIERGYLDVQKIPPDE